MYIFLINVISFRYDKDIGNQSFLNSSSLPFSSEYCDPNSWLLDTNSVRSAVLLASFSCVAVICKQRIYISPSILSRLYEINNPKASVNSVIIYDHRILENV